MRVAASMVMVALCAFVLSSYSVAALDQANASDQLRMQTLDVTWRESIVRHTDQPAEAFTTLIEVALLPIRVPRPCQVDYQIGYVITERRHPHDVVPGSSGGDAKVADPGAARVVKVRIYDTRSANLAEPCTPDQLSKAKWAGREELVARARADGLREYGLYIDEKRKRCAASTRPSCVVVAY